MRYLAIDFETNGRPHDRVYPCGAFPTQVSVTAFEPASGQITHLYDTYIRGARSLTRWVMDNTPVSFRILEHAPPAMEVSAALADLCRAGDVVVAHNAQFDLGMVLPKIADDAHPLFGCLTICTMREAWVRQAVGKLPKLQDLCALLDVPFDPVAAHDAAYDTMALAACMKEAHLRGHSWSTRLRPRPPDRGLFLDRQVPGRGRDGITTRAARTHLRTPAELPPRPASPRRSRSRSPAILVRPQDTPDDLTTDQHSPGQVLKPSADQHDN